MFGTTNNNRVVHNNNNNVYDSGNTNSYNSYSTVNIDNTNGNVTVINEARGTKRDLQSMRGIEKDERYEILTWLSEVDYEQHHTFISSSRQDNTGNWLFEKTDFIEWYTRSTSSIFWLHGMAGAGKTVLA
ncbi:hypothetical protein RUND412_010958 [Rhizina undulata]